MFPLYEKLVSADTVDRREEARLLVAGIHDSDGVSNWNFGRLVQAVLITEVDSGPAVPASACSGWFSDFAAADLLTSESRLNGYFRAIKEAKPFKSANEAGTGPGAILAVAAAVIHEARVDAYEINPKSAQCAKRIVELLGLEELVTIHESDVFTVKLNWAEVAITETFGPAITGGKQKEQGARVVARLAETCGVVLPHFALIHAQDVPTDFMEERGEGWRPVVWVDMTKPTEFVEGRLKSGGSGMRRVGIYSELYTASRTPVLCRHEGDGLSRDEILGGIELGGVQANDGDTLGFRYWISPDDPRPPEVWNETTGVQGISSLEGFLSASGDISVIY